MLGRLPEQILGRLDLGNDPLASLVEGCAILGRRNAACSAMEQPRPDALLQFLDRRRNRGARDAERVGGTGETCALDDAGEDAEQVDTVQSAPRLYGFSDR